MVMMAVKPALHFLRINALYDTVPPWPPGVTIRTDRLALFHFFGARTTLMIEGAPITRVFDATVVFSVLCKLLFGIAEEYPSLLKFCFRSGIILDLRLMIAT